MQQNTMGNFIAQLRKEAGITQKQLAEKLNVSDKTVSHWERGESTPDISLVPVLADVFGITCDDLIHGKRADKSVSDEKSTMQNEDDVISRLEKKLNKLRIRIVSCIISSFMAIPLGLFSALLFKDVLVGVVLFGLAELIALVLIMILYLSYCSNLNDAEISRKLAKEYKRKGQVVALFFSFYFIGLFLLLISVLIVKFDIGYSVLKSYLLFLIMMAYEIIFIMAVAFEIYKPKAQRKDIKKKVLLGAAVSAVILIIASATAVYQHNEKEGNLWVDVYTERYTDFEAFKSFMETEEKVYFDVCSDEPCFVYDPNDNLIQFEWNNGRVIEYELYDEEDEELCIFATCLPEGSTVYWNRITEFLFQASFFIYPVLMILGLASFEIGMICILKKSRNQNGDI
ncbi:MAG: helix-turn-helix domain-containing protein [Eubacterium sp.]